MRKRLPSAIATVTLAWLVGTADAAEPGTAGPQAAAPAAIALPDSPAVADSPAIFPGPGHENGNPDGGFTAGAALLIVKPFFQTNPGLSATRASVSPAGTATTILTSASDFDYSYSASPKLWLGWVSESGLGARVSWWRFDQAAKQQLLAFNTPVAAPLVGEGAASQSFFSGNASAGAVTPPLAITVGPLVGAAGETPATLIATSNLKVDVWDVEATQDCALGSWCLQLSGGVRYAHIDQNYNAYSAQPSLPGGALSNALLTGHNYDGAGPTVAGQLRRELGKSGLALIANVRGSELYGSGRQQATEQTVFVPAAGGPTLVTTSNGFHTHDGLLRIAEVELGVQYTQELGGARLFIQPALVGQSWSGSAGNASSQTGDLGFFGLELEIGVNF
ncbi:MAG TPA: Lpg1974 family pore-forming outer membrane protein [Gemmataceae bacterium]|nr:Lpg1974 family pore-forming outer membrane protein [Gemmataceae bacterium]